MSQCSCSAIVPTTSRLTPRLAHITMLRQSVICDVQRRAHGNSDVKWRQYSRMARSCCIHIAPYKSYSEYANHGGDSNHTVVSSGLPTHSLVSRVIGRRSTCALAVGRQKMHPNSEIRRNIENQSISIIGVSFIFSPNVVGSDCHFLKSSLDQSGLTVEMFVNVNGPKYGAPLYCK